MTSGRPINLSLWLAMEAKPVSKARRWRNILPGVHREGKPWLEAKLGIMGSLVQKNPGISHLWAIRRSWIDAFTSQGTAKLQQPWGADLPWIGSGQKFSFGLFVDCEGGPSWTPLLSLLQKVRQIEPLIYLFIKKRGSLTSGAEICLGGEFIQSVNKRNIRQ